MRIKDLSVCLVAKATRAKGSRKAVYLQLPFGVIVSAIYSQWTA
ncbi:MULTISPECIES: hypothetical protein [unclassified Lactococcus]|nr:MULTISPECIES: hypothetical protein [unclassified Lactococcus]